MKPTKEKIIMELIRIAHELDWAYFWKEPKRHAQATKDLEKVKQITKWREKVGG